MMYKEKVTVHDLGKEGYTRSGKYLVYDLYIKYEKDFNCVHYHFVRNGYSQDYGILPFDLLRSLFNAVKV